MVNKSSVVDEDSLCKSTIGLLDFHNHSTHSDGGDTPTELVKRAKQAGVSAMALTDHNIISGLEEFVAACRQEDIFAIPFGTEICAELPKEIIAATDHAASDFIILGKKAKSEPMKDYQALLLKDRRERYFPQTIEGLTKVGFNFPHLNLYEMPDSEVISEPKVFCDFIFEGNNLQVLVRYVRSVAPKLTEEEIKKQPIRFLNRYLYAIGTPAYTKRLEGFNIDSALDLTLSMNCQLFIAHPGGEFGFLSDRVLEYCIRKKVSGIEVRNYFNTIEQNAKFDRLAKEHQLIRSGGSDCHGDKGPFKIGIHDRPHNQLPKDILEELWYSLPN